MRTAEFCCATCACRIFATSPSTCPRQAWPAPGDTRVLGPFLREVVALNQEPRNFRVFGPDETVSNGLGALFETTARQWQAEIASGR